MAATPILGKTATATDQECLRDWSSFMETFKNYCSTKNPEEKVTSDNQRQDDNNPSLKTLIFDGGFLLTKYYKTKGLKEMFKKKEQRSNYDIYLGALTKQATGLLLQAIPSTLYQKLLKQIESESFSFSDEYFDYHHLKHEFIHFEIPPESCKPHLIWCALYNFFEARLPQTNQPLLREIVEVQPCSVKTP